MSDASQLPVDAFPARPDPIPCRAGIHARACRVLAAMLPGGQHNHRTANGSEVDVSFPGFRIEIKWPEQWRHGIGQATVCAAEDNACPVLALLCEHHRYSRARDNALRVIRAENLDVELIGVWLTPPTLAFWQCQEFREFFDSQPSLIDVNEVRPIHRWVMG